MSPGLLKSISHALIGHVQNRENQQSNFPRFAQPPVSPGKKIFWGSAKWKTVVGRDCAKIAALVKFFAPPAPRRASRIHFRTRLSDTPPTPTYIKNGLHCLLFHRLRRGPQGDQDPGEHRTRRRRALPLSGDAGLRQIIVFSPKDYSGSLGAVAR